MSIFSVGQNVSLVSKFLCHIFNTFFISHMPYVKMTIFSVGQNVSCKFLMSHFKHIFHQCHISLTHSISAGGCVSSASVAFQFSHISVSVACH